MKKQLSTPSQTPTFASSDALTSKSKRASPTAINAASPHAVSTAIPAAKKKSKSPVDFTPAAAFVHSDNLASGPQHSSLLIQRITRENVSEQTISALGHLVHAQWNLKEGGQKSIDEYTHEIRTRFEHAHTPVLVASLDDAIVGAIFPLRFNHAALAPTWKELTGNGTWNTDDSKGPWLACPQICVYKDAKAPDGSKPPVARALIDGVLEMAREMNGQSPILHLIAYSRPTRYDEFRTASPGMSIGQFMRMSYDPRSKKEPQWQTSVQEFNAHAQAHEQALKNRRQIPQNALESMTDFLRIKGRRHVDPVIGMHLSYGARILRVLPDACPDDISAGGYGVIMDYTHALRQK